MKFKTLLFAIVGILAFFPVLAIAADIFVTVTFHAGDDYYIDECRDTTIQGPYHGDKWMHCKGNYFTVTCEKRIKNAKKGVYKIEGAISARWKKSKHNAITTVPYDVDIVYSTKQDDVQKRGRLDATSCDSEHIASFSVK